MIAASQWDTAWDNSWDGQSWDTQAWDESWDGGWDKAQSQDAAWNTGDQQATADWEPPVGLASLNAGGALAYVPSTMSGSMQNPFEVRLEELLSQAAAGATAPAVGQDWTWDDLVPSKEMPFVRICEPFEEDCSTEKLDHDEPSEQDARDPTISLDPVKKELAATVGHFT